MAVRPSNSSTSTVRQSKRKTCRERVTFYYKHRVADFGGGSGGGGVGRKGRGEGNTETK